MAAPSLRLPLLAALASMALFGSPPSFAQPVLDLALDDAQLAVTKGCAILTVNFNIRIRYASHFPLNHGDELRITVNPIDRDRAAALMIRTKREAARVPDGGKLAAIKAIVFETDQFVGPVLRIQFDYPVFYQVAPNSGEQNLVVAISGKKPLASCKPSFPDNDVAAIGATRIKDRPSGKMSDIGLRTVAGWMDEGRAALRKGNYDGAIRLFAKVLKYPENQYSPEAQELLGLARQKKGQLAEARGEYEDYLRRYPANEGSLRVGQRLAGLITANGDPAGPLRLLNGQPPGAAKAGVLLQPRETVWTFSGSASEFYVRNDSFNTVRDPSIAPDPTADPDSHRVHQNEVLSSIDAVATWNNDQTKGKIRFSGSEEHSFNSDPNDLYGVAALFVDAQVKDWNLRTVVGRQTLNTDGVLGRFDGALLSWQALPWIRFDLVGGSPAVSRFDLPFKDEKYFYGGSVTFGQFFGGLDTTIYAIEQRDRWLVDREAVGAEFRYFQQDKFIFGTVDYDTNFNRLNAAVFSGSWTLPDKSTIYGGADYRRTPYLSTWNALLNQPFITLYDMLRFDANEPLQQLALDQTPTYKSAMLGFSHPLSDKLQISADATVVNLTQPIIIAAGVDPSLATLPAGNEYYYSAQLIGSNIFKPGDMYITALRYSQMSTSNMYALDFNMRYPLTNDFRLSPRLRLAYQTGNGIDLTEYTILPSVLLNYYWDKNLNFELEIGAQWTRSHQAGVQNTDTELFLTAGLRYDFYADDTSKRAGDERRCGSPGATALCRYVPASQGNNCASTPGACPR